MTENSEQSYDFDDTENSFQRENLVDNYIQRMNIPAKYWDRAREDKENLNKANISYQKHIDMMMQIPEWDVWRFAPSVYLSDQLSQQEKATLIAQKCLSLARAGMELQEYLPDNSVLQKINAFESINPLNLVRIATEITALSDAEIEK